MSSVTAPEGAPLRRRAVSVRRRGDEPWWASPPARFVWILVGLAIVGAAWQIYALANTTDSARAIVPTLDATLVEFGILIADPVFWGDLLLTLRAWSLGLLIGAVIAIPIGVILGTTPRIYKFVRVPIEIARPIPPIVILPLVLLVLGTGLNFQILLVVWAVSFPLIIQTTYGVQLTHKVLIDTARSFTISKLRTIMLFRVPAAAPNVSTSLKLSAAMAFGVTIMTEFVGGSWGIGRTLLLAQLSDNVARTYAVTLFIGLVGVVIMGLFTIVESRFARWAPGGARR